MGKEKLEMKKSDVDKVEIKSWKEINKSRREERRKRREESLRKKQMASDTKSQTMSEKKVPYKEISTVSIAVPGSILDNAQSDELKAYLAGQIARAAAIFQIDEVVVFDDLPKGEIKKTFITTKGGIKSSRKCCAQFAKILQYLECPQYLRKHFFPLHKDLSYVGVLNPIDTPHHLRQDNKFIFREGVVTNKPPKTNRGSQVNVGLAKDVEVDKLLTPGLRCTVKITNQDNNTKKLKGVIVSPLAPRQETGVYWGYTIRIADSISQIFSQCPYKEGKKQYQFLFLLWDISPLAKKKLDPTNIYFRNSHWGYDLLLGTSDKGQSIDECDTFVYDHLLIVFGGLAGLEAAFESDELLKINDPSLLFDYYLNTLPSQGSRTIRTEEAVLISLAAFRPKLNPKNKPVDFSSNKTEAHEKKLQANSSEAEW